MKTVYLEKHDLHATLTCWIACLMWLDWAASKEGLVGYYYWPREHSIVPLADPAMFAREPNMFDWWFLQPNATLLNLKPGQRPPQDETWLWESMPPGNLCPGKWPMGENTYAWYQRLKIRPEIVARADALVAKYGLDLNNTIGLSWRGCESRADLERDRPSEEIENYFPPIDQFLTSEPDLQIFATAEEQGIAEKVQARYPGRTVIIPEFWTVPLMHGSDAADARGHSNWCNPASGYERGVLTCLLISILSRCKYYIKNKSNMSNIAQWIKGGQGVVRIGSRAHAEFWG